MTDAKDVPMWLYILDQTSNCHWCKQGCCVTHTPEATERARLLDHIATLTRERDEARTTSQYWKDEKLASEREIDTLTRERDEAIAKYGVANECHEYALRLYKETLAAHGNATKLLADQHDVLVAMKRERDDARRDGERYRFLRENRLGLRAVDGNAGLWEQPKVRENLDWYVDAVIDNPEYVDDAARTADAGAL
jgi:hypothetical protein